MVECDLAKVEVAGSNPVSRSKNQRDTPVSDKGLLEKNHVFLKYPGIIKLG